MPDISMDSLASSRRNQSENRAFRRASLLSAAITAVARHDLSGATVERICDLAGASRGLIAHYFDSKEALLLAAFQHWFDMALDIKTAIASDQSLDAESRLVAIAESTLSAPSYTWENAAAWQAFTNAGRYDDAFAEPIRAASRYVIQLTTPLFAEAATARGVEIDAKQAATGLYILTDGLWNSLATRRDNLSLSRAKTCCRRFIEGSFLSTS